MEESKTPAPLPDPSQAAVIQCSAGSRQLVLAPPGTGKTFVLIERLKYLVDRGVTPGRIVVLSFTRAAVREIRQRLFQQVDLGQASLDVRLVELRTFDSVASRLLIAAGVEVQDLGYDERIEAFTRTLISAEGESAAHLRRIIRNIEHLIVDEVQDLVGVRARMVQAMLMEGSMGFTFLGDPDQAIYNYQVEDQGGPNAEEFLQWVRGRPWEPPLVERSLVKNYRHSARMREIARVLVESLRSRTTQSDRALYQNIRRVLDGVPLQPILYDGKGPAEGLPEDSRSVILCRNNGEVLDLMQLLSRNKVPFRYQPSVEERSCPAWIARVLTPDVGPRIDKEEFVVRYEELVSGHLTPGPDAAWNALQEAAGARGSTIEISSLVTGLARGSLPDDFYAGEEQAEGILLSTIHRAKGREFDHVRLLMSDRFGEEAAFADEARVLYVAATRAREGMDRLSSARRFPVLKDDGSEAEQGRWMTFRSGKCYAFEVGQPGDVDPSGPINLYLHRDHSGVKKIQEYLWDTVQVGDTVLIQKVPRGRAVFYQLRHLSDHGWHTLGQMSLSFRESVSRHLGCYPWQFQWAHIVAKCTEVQPGYPSGPYDRDYVRHGLWINIRIRALARVKF